MFIGAVILVPFLARRLDHLGLHMSSLMVDLATPISNLVKVETIVAPPAIATSRTAVQAASVRRGTRTELILGGILEGSSEARGQDTYHSRLPATFAGADR